MKIQITRLEDSMTCATCGYNYAFGYRVTIDGKVVIDMPPTAHCYDPVSYDDDHLINALLEYFVGYGADVEFDYEDVSR